MGGYDLVWALFCGCCEILRDRAGEICYGHCFVYDVKSRERGRRAAGG